MDFHDEVRNGHDHMDSSDDVSTDRDQSQLGVASKLCVSKTCLFHRKLDGELRISERKKTGCENATTEHRCLILRRLPNLTYRGSLVFR